MKEDEHRVATANAYFLINKDENNMRNEAIERDSEHLWLWNRTDEMVKWVWESMKFWLLGIESEKRRQKSDVKKKINRAWPYEVKNRSKINCLNFLVNKHAEKKKRMEGLILLWKMNKIKSGRQSQKKPFW